jgi:hypothetical protein
VITALHTALNKAPASEGLACPSEAHAAAFLRSIECITAIVGGQRLTPQQEQTDMRIMERLCSVFSNLSWNRYELECKSLA